MISCFKIEDLKRFHLGRLAPYVYPEKRQIAHAEKIPHIIIRLFAKDLNGRYLVQKRSIKKKYHKGKWTDSTSGHVIFPEDRSKFTYEDIEWSVRRELKEEIGTELLSVRFYKLFLDKIGEEEFELNYVFVGFVKSNIILNLNEVDEKSGFFSELELKKILNTKDCVNVAKEIWLDIIDGKTNILFENMNRELNQELNQKNKKQIPSGISLIIGRFQPFHKGHQYLIKKSFEYTEKLKIGIGSSQFSDKPENPFTYEERKLFIKLSLSDGKIHPSNYEIFPIEDKFNIYTWIDGVIDTVGNFDIIITNNLWIGRLFQQKNKKLIYGLKCEFKKYNGTQIRSQIYNNNPKWTQNIPHSVYKYIAQRPILKRLRKMARKLKKN
ncbi:MAG: nicotinamide-nucleotide adenylyltransferase [Promethearchaeota archaeon]